MQASHFLTDFGYDLGAFVVSAGLLLIYHRFLVHKVRQDPGYTVQSVNVIARTAWVHAVMRDGKQHILPVQTLRNSTMAATFLASTSVLLIIGAMNLTGQANKLDSSWHALNLIGSTHAALWQLKVLLILIDLFFAFFSFSMAIRLFNHAGFLINVPANQGNGLITPAHVAAQLNQAGHFFSMGMRSYHFLMPLVFWLFGPPLLLAGTLGLIAVLYHVDRTPQQSEGGDPEAGPRSE